MRFEFEDAGGDVTRGRAHWILRAQRITRAPNQEPPTVTSGTVQITLMPATIAGKVRGEAHARLSVEQPGRYILHLQVEDAAGHKSNVLETGVVVETAWPRDKTPGECGAAS